MKLKIISAQEKDAAADITVKKEVFGCEFNEPLVHQLLEKQIAESHAGTKAQKNRSEVSGGGAKPWRQKGTGRARAGTNRSPIWVGGGVTFAADPDEQKRGKKRKLNKKMYKAGMRCIWSELVRQKRLFVVDELVVESPKTKEFLAQLDAMKLPKEALIVTEKVEGDLFLAARNVPKIEMVDAAGVNAIDLLKFDNIILTQASIGQIEEMLA